MTIEYEKLVDARVARFLKRKLTDQAWRVEDAKAKLTSIMKRSRSGETQVIGVRKPVVVMSLEDLQEMLLGFRRPSSWGEYFYPASAGRAIEGELRVPDDSNPSAYSLASEGEEYDMTVAVNRPVTAKAREKTRTGAKTRLASKLDLALDYLNKGDQGSACSIIETVISEERETAADTAPQPTRRKADRGKT